MNKILTIIMTVMLLFCGNVAWSQNEPPQGAGAGFGHGAGRGPGGGKPKDRPKDKQKDKSKKKTIKARDYAVENAKDMYIFGVALNPTDSVIYVTDELILDSAQVYKKSKFLVYRNEYSNQLKLFLESRGEQNRTCAVTYATSIRSLDSKFKKEMAYLKKHGYLIKHVDQTEFRFTAVRNEQ